ncbi:MAG: phenylalanine--tRNA ligase subunit beta [Gammaproteobacteria bacterium]|nr:phenylalanine--tRNA ligase subunit beta [Gammaproteobacteria bacterium]MDH3560980.1 phenylalanine--tRNA ligase subunit beta [Gammaproteobacteria bacterium]
MKFSEKWLREWVDPPVSTAGLVEQLTMAGLEVDSVEPVAAGMEGLVVGEVLTVEAHPDADKLHVCQVEVGQPEPLQIVCGAPNVRAGGKYPLALIGARLPGDFKIKKSKLRGVESYGMLCSARELGLSDEHQGLMELPADGVAGQDVLALLGLDDTLIEIDLTPNRGDCLGVEGVAREVGTLTRSPVHHLVVAAVPETLTDRLAIDVQAPHACPRYLGRIIRGIDPKASTPLWMQERLRRSGLRSIDPVVDVTNYVLLELGQPMHAFDLAQIAGGIQVRYAEENEQLTLLDKRELTLDSETLVIADHEKPLAIAGVMGGIHSGVQADTTDLFLECAYFSPEVIAGRARKYAMHTDSSHRFERGVDPQLQGRALQRATQLLLDIVGGQAGPVAEVAATEHLPQYAPISLRKDRILRVLGMLPEPAEVSDILERLGMQVTEEGDGWQVIPPSFRFDIALEADLIEEIGRVYGYDKLPLQPLSGALDIQPVPETEVSIEAISDLLVARGYQEAITYSFVDPDFQAVLNPEMRPIPLANPISSEMSQMRTSLWPGLLKAAIYNLNRQQSRLRLFEHGLRFYSQGNKTCQDHVISGVCVGARAPEHWDGQAGPVDFYDLRRDVEAMLSLSGRTTTTQFMMAAHPALHPGQSAMIRREGVDVGWLGMVHPSIANQFDLDPQTFLFELEYAPLKHGDLVRFREISRYPSIRRDLAVVVDADVQADMLKSAIREVAGELLKEVVIFDIYQGKGVETGRKSVAFGLILQDSSRTLTDEDVEAVVTGVIACLRGRFQATLRE